MRRILVLFCLALSTGTLAWSQDKPDPIADELAKAKEVYRSAVDKAKKNVLQGFAVEEQRIRASATSPEDLKAGLAIVQGEKKDFETYGAAPKAYTLRRHKNVYEAAMADARKKCERAFDVAATKYGRVDLAAAKAVLQDKAIFFDAAAVAKPADPAVATAGPGRVSNAPGAATAPAATAPAAPTSSRLTVAGEWPEFVAVELARIKSAYETRMEKARTPLRQAASAEVRSFRLTDRNILPSEQNELAQLRRVLSSPMPEMDFPHDIRFKRYEPAWKQFEKDSAAARTSSLKEFQALADRAAITDAALAKRIVNERRRFLPATDADVEEFNLAEAEVAALGPVRSEIKGPPIDLRRHGTHGFPQQFAQVLCDTEDLRVSVCSDENYLFLQAILWNCQGWRFPVAKRQDPEDPCDYLTTVALDFDGNAKRSVGDADYHSRFSLDRPVRWLCTQTSPIPAFLSSTHSGHAGMEHVADVQGGRPRVDSFLLPLNEHGKQPGDAIRLTYTGFQFDAECNRRVLNSVGLTIKPRESLEQYYDQFHRLTLADSKAPLDARLFPVSFVRDSDEQASFGGRQPTGIATPAEQTLQRDVAKVVLQQPGNSFDAVVGSHRVERLFDANGVPDGEYQIRSAWLRQLSPEIVTQLARLPRLQELLIDPPGDPLSPRLFAPLQRSATLSRVQIGKGLTAQVGECLAELARIPNLRALDVASSRLKDDDLASLRPCLSLREITLPPTITDRGLTEIADQQPHVKDLDVSLCEAVTPAGLSQLTAIEGLTIGPQHITPECGAAIARLPKLQRLTVHGPPSDVDFSVFQGGSFAEISWLEADTTHRFIPAQQIRSFLSLANVHRFHIDGVRILDQHVPLLRDLPPGRQLRLTDTYVSRDGLKRILVQLPDVDVRMEPIPLAGSAADALLDPEHLGEEPAPIAVP
jgi:hypothetical protein